MERLEEYNTIMRHLSNMKDILMHKLHQGQEKQRLDNLLDSIGYAILSAEHFGSFWLQYHCLRIKADTLIEFRYFQDALDIYWDLKL